MKIGSKIKKTALTVLLAMCVFMTACGGTEEGTSGKGGAGAVKDVVGEYYLDLSKLGMKLTVYLRISEDGTFQFSNTTDFKINKSAGTIEKGTDKYIMVYESVNGEEKNLSEGVTSSFVVKDDKTLDFSGCERIYYGSATAITVSAEDPSIILTGVPIPDDYQEVRTESEFTPGTYTGENGDVSYRASFFEDNSYLLVVIRSENGAPHYSSESGIYGVSTTQLALTPTGDSRLSGEIVSGSELSIPVPGEGSEERTAVPFTKQDSAETEAVFSGQGAKLTIYTDNTFSSEAAGFTENGIIVFDSESGTFKIYPDHPETGIRGLNQISTVPSGTFTNGGGKMQLTDFRLRESESLSRTKCNFTQN